MTVKLRRICCAKGEGALRPFDGRDIRWFPILNDTNCAGERRKVPFGPGNSFS
jgi:hypothetical protein